ncbi:MAG: CotH kinase family protein [Clostridia bacterium]
MRKALSVIFMIGAVLLAAFTIQHVELSVARKSAIEMEPPAPSVCEHGADTFCSHLPLIMINTDGQRIQKESKIWTDIAVLDGEGMHHTDDLPPFSTAATVKYRGASSYAVFDKKSYRIKFFKHKEGKAEMPYALAGMAADCEWVLNGPFLDRTLLRNYITFGVCRGMFEWSPDTRFCELFIDGKYQGVYLIIEPITVGPGRIELTPFGLLSGQTAYLVHRDRSNTELDPLTTYGNTTGMTHGEVSIDYPSATKLTPVQRRWIEKDFNRFEQVLYSDDFANPATGYAAYIDVASFVDYYIINEFSMTVDASQLSTYLYKPLNGKLHMTVWDFNNAYNNFPWSIKYCDKFYITNKNWYDRLLQDRAFTDIVVERYHELRQGLISDEQLFAAIDDGVRILGDAVNRNFDIWGYTFKEKMLSDNDDGSVRDPRSYNEAIAMLKSTIAKRGDFLDAHIQELYELCIN